MIKFEKASKGWINEELGKAAAKDGSEHGDIAKDGALKPAEGLTDVVDAATAEKQKKETDKIVADGLKDAEKVSAEVRAPDPKAPAPKCESFSIDVKDRKDLGKLIEGLKKDGSKFIITKSTKEGYRYAVKTTKSLNESDGGDFARGLKDGKEYIDNIKLNQEDYIKEYGEKDLAQRFSASRDDDGFYGSKEFASESDEWKKGFDKAVDDWDGSLEECKVTEDKKPDEDKHEDDKDGKKPEGKKEEKPEDKEDKDEKHDDDKSDDDKHDDEHEDDKKDEGKADPLKVTLDSLSKVIDDITKEDNGAEIDSEDDGRLLCLAQAVDLVGQYLGDKGSEANADDEFYGDSTSISPKDGIPTDAEDDDDFAFGAGGAAPEFVPDADDDDVSGFSGIGKGE